MSALGSAALYSPVPLSLSLSLSLPMPMHAQQQPPRFAFDAPSLAGAMHAAAAFSHPMGMPAPALKPLSIKGYDGVGAQGTGYFDAPGSASAMYDLGMGFNGAESLLLGGGAEMGIGVGMGMSAMSGGMGTGTGTGTGTGRLATILLLLVVI
ncbi:hypothetical protein DFH06DRAFT_1336604 [Mycena polygramma]|nr:hypothetical protein DFH06DRAFT_1336604 [Mycena polygramma]